jgi:hypothetical protein
VSGRTQQDVIEALKKESDELDAGLSTSRSYNVETSSKWTRTSRCRSLRFLPGKAGALYRRTP